MMNKSEQKHYKSPAYKLIQFFEKSRNQWREKCTEAKYTIKLLKTKVRDLTKSRQKWKERCKQKDNEIKEKQSEIEKLQAELDKVKKSNDQKKSNNEVSFDDYPVNHSYSTDQILLFILFVLEGAIGFRSSSRIMELINRFFSLSLSVPTGNTGRLWLMRIGYYKLMRSKEVATDWILILDHTAELGQEKCLFILGIRLCNLPPAGQCLSHQDLEPIELCPVKKSNGAIVYEQLEEVVKKTGVPRAILSDHGSDLTVGIRLFCQQHPETSQLYDIKHKTAALLKRELTRDADWIDFTQKANQTKKQVQQTEFAFLEPPKQKTKARYMNVVELIQWGNHIQSFLQYHKQQQNPEYDIERLKERFGWVENYQKSIARWSEMVDVTTRTEQLVREQGLTVDSYREISFRLPFDYTQERTHHVLNELIQFVAMEASCVKSNERLPGSSEVLESCFGKQKHIEKTQAKKGFTGLILGLPALVSNTTSEIIREALESVPTKTVIEWYKENFGESVHA